MPEPLTSKYYGSRFTIIKLNRLAYLFTMKSKEVRVKSRPNKFCPDKITNCSSYH